MKKLLLVFCLLSAACVSGPKNISSDVEMGNVSEYVPESAGGYDLSKFVPRQTQIIDIYTGRPFRDNSIAGTVRLNASNYTLVVHGLVENPKNLSFSDIFSRPMVSRVITMNCVEGWSNTANWTGFTMKGLIEEVKPLPEAETVVFRAADGYSTSFTLDDPVLDDLLLVYMANGYPLPYTAGYPLRSMIETKYGYKLAKWITEIEFIEGEYHGTWEEAGYSNKGDYGGPAFD